jgi:hypothetical protein
VAVFYSRYEKALRASATGPVMEGRLQGQAPVVVADLANASDTRPAPAHFELFGPGDVQRLAAGAITRRFPAPGASDAEETKLALVEFAAADLPWRYTPAAATPQLRPWLVLVVGRRSPDEVVLRQDGRVTLGVTAQVAHRLGLSSRWAHVHEVDGRVIARVVGPMDLQSETEYLACVVPAFDASGVDAWTGVKAVTVDCYDRWSFRTGPRGDFPDLAGKLRKADLSAIEASGGKPFGRAELTYVRRGPGHPPRVVLAAAGALRLPPGPGPGPGQDPFEEPLDPTVAAEVTALTRRIVTPDGRGVVTAPRYDAPFREADPAPSVDPGGWVDQTRGDPRVRGAAGLGAWAAIEWQDRISDAAAAKAGDLATADDRVRHVALGVEASRSLWRRRLPPDPVERLTVLAPVLGRMPAETHRTVLDEIVGRTPQLGRALLSSAARRALRPGPARTALAQADAGKLSAVLNAANDCPPEAEDPADIAGDPRIDADDVARAIEEAVRAAAGGDEELIGRVLDRLGGGFEAGPALLFGAFRALAPGPDGRPDPDVLDAFLSGREEYHDPDLVLWQWPDWMNETVPPEPCRPIDLGALAAAVADAVDPTVAMPPAARRVLSTLEGIASIGPVEIEPELDLPLWSFVSNRSPDWMLPGTGDLKEHDVVGLATNPAFVHALLAGANHQATSELRWRNVPLVTRWSPLRKFWQRRGGELDILPLRQWPDAKPLGSTALVPDGRSAEAVVAFRTSLFRRYPATVVYLYAADADWRPPPDNAPLQGPPARKDPTFTGTIGDDVVFFGFAVPPSALATHWVVLEEPPAGYRFYHGSAVPEPWPGASDNTSDGYAYNRFAAPVRVLIGPLL